MPFVFLQSPTMTLVEVKIPVSATASDVGELERHKRNELFVIVQLDARRTASLPWREEDDMLFNPAAFVSLRPLDLAQRALRNSL